MKWSVVCLLFLLAVGVCCLGGISEAANYYVDSVGGSDSNSGTSPDSAWQTIAKVNSTTFSPGDTIHLKCGSQWVNDPMWFTSAGTEANPITITSYGTGTRPHLSYPSAVLHEDVVLVEGADWVIVENLIVSDGGEAGVRLTESNYCIIRNCESYNNGMGFETERTAQYNLITNNYAHDMHAVVNTLGGNDDYGGVGVWLYAGNSEVSYNTLIDCRYVSYDYGWDGGAVEFYSKHTKYGGTGNCDNVYIHHNWSEGCEGFLEVGGEKWTACLDSVAAWNVSKNYSNFLCLHIDGKFGVDTQRFRAENNTIDHPGGQYYVISWAGNTPNVDSCYFRNNIIQATGLDQVSTTGSFTHEYNCYNVDFPIGYTLDPTEFTGDPMFVEPANNNYRLQASSPCRDTGTNLGWTSDFDGNPVPSGSGYDIGAFEYQVLSLPPVTDFSGHPTDGNAPLLVMFTDLSTVGTPTAWSWAFGDNGTSSAKNPNHEYINTGQFTVSLEACNEYGCDIEIKTDYITVNEAENSCHVGNISLVGKYTDVGPPSQRGYYAEATITVHDGACAPLGEATVDITWS